MSEFELTIRCSKDIKRITLDFGDSSGALVEFSEKQEHDEQPQKSLSNKAIDPLERYLSVQTPVSEKKPPTPIAASNLPVPDVQGRPPLVDEGFNESL